MKARQTLSRESFRQWAADEYQRQSDAMRAHELSPTQSDVEALRGQYLPGKSPLVEKVDRFIWQKFCKLLAVYYGQGAAAAKEYYNGEFLPMLSDERLLTVYAHIAMPIDGLHTR